MSNKKGFTLVELMVVIVIIGVLAAVAIPRLMAAADRARAGEGPQTLGAISRMQHAYRVEHPNFWSGADWRGLGFTDEAAPQSRFFVFTVTASANGGIGSTPAFVATATTTANLPPAGQAVAINQNDARGSTPDSKLRTELLPTVWRHNIPVYNTPATN